MRQKTIELQYTCERGYAWTEILTKAELQRKFEEAAHKKEMARARAINEAIVSTGMRLTSEASEIGPESGPIAELANFLQGGHKASTHPK